MFIRAGENKASLEILRPVLKLNCPSFIFMNKKDAKLLLVLKCYD